MLNINVEQIHVRVVKTLDQLLLGDIFPLGRHDIKQEVINGGYAVTYLTVYLVNLVEGIPVSGAACHKP